jgi:predicted metal-binding membrane protein
MPGQTWLGAAASFLGMWMVMMAAMMLPALVPMLAGYRRSVRELDGERLGQLTALAGAGYCFVWAVFGIATYPLGILVGAAEMRWQALARLVPIATGIVVVLAGCLQLSAWKARHLRCCRNASGCGPWLAPDAQGAWRYGLRLGVHCSQCCSSFMLILLVTGVMDLGTMAGVATAITVERLTPWPEMAARAAGMIAVATGALVIARAVGAV